MGGQRAWRDNPARDVEALKAFLSREVFTVRPAYGHFDITKPALASFIGTVNNSAGIFSDPTGSRRFWATTLTAIDWKYRAAVDIGQVWAEAHAAYLSGKDWRLSPDEATWAREINQSFEAEDPIENLLRKHFRIEPHDGSLWTSTADILLHLQTNGLQGNTKANQMALSATLKRLCLVRGERGKQRGYIGITLT